MAYLRNSTVNLLNVHYGLHALILNGAGAFYAVFLLKAGVPAAAVLAAVALLLAGRFIMRPMILVLAPRVGLRRLVVFGTVFGGLQYLILPMVHRVDLLLLLLCLISAIGDTFYWTCYHAYFARLGDAEHRGHQLGAREAIAALAGIVGPLIWGVALTLWGPWIAFGAAAGMHVLAALPFLGTPEVAIAPAAPGAFRAAIPGILMFACDGWLTAGYITVWQIALFLSLGENYSSFGSTLALAGLVGAGGSLILGRHIDAGHGTRAVWLTFAGLLATTLLRAASTENVAMAVGANALGALVGCLYQPTLMTAVYNQAKRSPCTLRFHVATEGGWDIGGASGFLTVALLTALGLPLSWGILVSLLGMGLLFALLQRYYGGLEIRPAGMARPLPGQ